jgi:large subunit ribosomal protein L17
MVTSLFKYERIKTTDAKAKELRRWADHIVTLAKRGDLHARRLAMSIVREKDVVHKIFEEASERFGSFSGGYTRMIKIGRRQGDTASMTLVELVRSDESRPAKKRRAKKKVDVKAEVQPSAPTAAADDQTKETEAQVPDAQAEDTDFQAEEAAPEPAEAQAAAPADSKSDDSAEEIDSEDTKKDQDASVPEK